MLGKLLKYDFKAMLKTILPLWIVAIAVSVFFGIFNKMEIESDIARATLTAVLFAVFVAIIVINVMLVIQRFWNGLLKDEGYLMFTIPTSPRMLILSKAISATVISIITGIVAYICVMIIMVLYMVDFNDSVFSDMVNILTNLSGKEILTVLLFVLAMIVGAIERIYEFYAAMSLGQLGNKNRFLASVGFFLVINIVISMVTNTISSVFGMTSVWGEMMSGDLLTLNTFNSIVGVSIIFGIIVTIILHIMTEYMLTKRLNLE